MNVQRTRFACLVLLGSLLGLSLAVQAQNRPILLPAVRQAQWQQETIAVSRLKIEVPDKDSADLFAASDLADAAKAAGLDIDAISGVPVVLLRASNTRARAYLAAHRLNITPEMEGEGYILSVDADGIVVIAASGEGVFYGVQSLKQLLPLRGERAEIHEGVVRDWPAMRYRGISDDLSRGPFPTLDFLKHQIRVLASFKINLYSPYMEHVLLFPDHPLAAPAGGSLTPEAAQELVRYASQYHVMIVPEQEAFGHLHHILKYDLYKDVAETENGHVLSPVQAGTIPLIKDWFTLAASEFPAPFLHIGADETFDLGQGRTRDEVATKGYGPVYVNFLTQIHDALSPLHRRLLFWGDIGGSDPAAVAKLPKDMIAIPWNYWDTKGFEKMIDPFAKQGIETWVAPGDGNWNEVVPAARSAFGNIQGFIRDGQRLGSTGALTTVWNDDGEGLFNLDWYGALFGAVAAWQPGESSISSYQAGYGLLFHGDRSGRVDAAEKKLIDAMEALASSHSGYNSDTLFWMDPWSQQGQAVSAKILPVVVVMRTDAEEAIELILEARRDDMSLRESDALAAMEMGARRLDLIGLKFELADQIVRNYSDVYAHQDDKNSRSTLRNKLDEISSMFGRCQDLRDGYSATKDSYRKVWLSENTPYWLENVLVRYDLRIQLWQMRGEKFREAEDDFEHHRAMPSPDAMGLPALAPDAGNEH